MTVSRPHRSPARPALVTALLACLLTGSACAGGATSGLSDPAQPAGVADTSPGQTARPHVPADAGLPTAVPAMEPGPAATAGALATAGAAVTAFTRRDLGPEPWWAGVLPFLSPRAAQAYLGTDPALVPAGEVVGEPTAGPSPSDLLAVVTVPTDTGACSVLLSRTDDGTGWQVERLSWAAAGTVTG